MIATPLGLLAAGTAWGEWGASDFANPTLRAEIAKASGATAPAAVPAGLERLSSVWTAPLPVNAPPFMHSEVFGYIMSALIGVGLIILAFLLISWLMRRN